MAGIKDMASRATGELRSIATTPSGWAGIVVGNVMMSALWAVPFGLGLALGDGGLVMAAGAIAAFMALPLSFSWLGVLWIASAVRRTIDYMVARRKRRK